MFRLKRKWRSLLLYLVVGCCWLTLINYHNNNHDHKGGGQETQENQVTDNTEYETDRWVKLSEDLFVFSAYWETRPLGLTDERKYVAGRDPPFVRVITIARVCLLYTSPSPRAS